MGGQTKRVTTKYKNIYLNQSTKKYDVKYNYKVYDPLTQKNKYKAKWKYGIATLAEAKEELAKMRMDAGRAEDKDITLQGAFELWKVRAQAQNFSPTTVRNTEQQLRMIGQFLPLETKIKDITEEIYYKVFSDCREYGYSEETLHSINATFRKLIDLVYKKRLINDNPLHRTDNIKTKKTDAVRILTHEEWTKLDHFFDDTKFVRLGVDRYPKFRFMFNVLYYTGIRIGECLALTYQDFEELQGMRLRITKSMLVDGTIKEPKNFKKRTIPLNQVVACLYMADRDAHIGRGGKISDRVFDYGYGNCLMLITKACRETGVERCSLHDFRHTYISNLIRKNVPLPVIEKVSGDIQETIFKRYSHMFEGDEKIVLKALEELQAGV